MIGMRKDGPTFWKPVHQVRGEIREDLEIVGSRVVEQRRNEGLPDLTKEQGAWLGDVIVIVLLGYALLRTTEAKKLIDQGVKSLDELVLEMREARAKANRGLDDDSLWIAAAVEDTVEFGFQVGVEAERLVA